jgi:hypothetical protein
MDSKRIHAARKTAPKPVPPAPASIDSQAPVDPRDATLAALKADTGPLVITIAGNLVSGMVQVVENSNSAKDVAVLMEWLDSARGYLQAKLLQAAEARGRAAAAATPPPVPPPG